MEHLLRAQAGAALAAVLLSAACRNEAALAQKEKRALADSVYQAQDTVLKLNMKEPEGAGLSVEEAATRRRLKEQAEEDENGGNSPAPPPTE